MPAGCGLGQIKSLIREGGWREERGNGKAEERRDRNWEGGGWDGSAEDGVKRNDEGVSEGEDRKWKIVGG